MRFDPIIVNNDLNAIKLSSATESVSFRLKSSNGKRKWANLPTIFNALNNLLGMLDIEDSDRLYTIYKNLLEASDYRVAPEFDVLVQDLITYINEIYELLPIEGIMAWAKSYPDFKVPESIGPDRVKGNYEKSKSYTRKEYILLCGLSTALKLVLPVTYQFSNYFKSIYGTALKDYHLLKLLEDIGLDQCEPYRKLLDQAIDTVKTDTGELAIPMGIVSMGIGQEQYPEFIIAADTLRSLALSETDCGTRESGCANNIARKITQGIESAVDRQVNRYDWKNIELPKDTMLGESGNTSRQEASNTIEEFSGLYEPYFIKEFGRDNLYQRFGIDYKLFCVFKEHIDRYGLASTLTPSKENVIGLIISDFAYLKALRLLDLHAAGNVLATAATYLHQHELHTLTSFILVREDTDSIEPFHANRNIIKTKANKQLLDEARGKFITTDDGKNSFDVELKRLVDNIIGCQWYGMSPEALHETYQLNSTWYGSATFQTEMCQLVLLTCS